MSEPDTGPPFSPACENNRDPILRVLEKHLAHIHEVLEIGSGTGQHGVYFAARLPHLRWQPSDLAANLAGIEAWRRRARLPNLHPPIELDVSWQQWPVRTVRSIFSANSLHIMSWQAVADFFSGVGRVLEPGGMLIVYGPFNYGGEYTSASNARFDAMLKSRDPLSGLRDFAAVNALAADIGLTLVADHAMPANNRSLVWRRG